MKTVSGLHTGVDEVGNCMAACPLIIPGPPWGRARPVMRLIRVVRVNGSAGKSKRVSRVRPYPLVVTDSSEV